MKDETESGPTYLEQKKELIESLLSDYSYEGWSQRPNTFVRVVFHRPDGTNILQHSWAKVSSGDKWDINEGVKVAVRKAAGRVAKLALLPKDKLEKVYPPLGSATQVSGRSKSAK